MTTLRPVRRIVAWRRGADDLAPGDVVLAVGMSPSAPRLAEVLESAAGSGAAAAVVQGFADLGLVRSEARRTGVPVLVAPRSVRWDDVRQRLVDVLGASPAPPPRHTDSCRNALTRESGTPVVTGAKGDRNGMAALTFATVGFRPREPWAEGSVAALALCDELDAATASIHGAVTLAVGGHVYALMPSAGRDVAQRLEALARAGSSFAATRLQRAVGAVIDPEYRPFAQLQRGRAEIDRALAFLATEDVPGIGTVGELRPHVILAELRRLADDHPALLSGPIDVLRELDETRNTQYLPTLQAYFDAAGDPTEAAKAMYVHANTVRYRLRRLQELGGLNLKEPLDRLILELQLRLRPPRSVSGDGAVEAVREA